MFGVKVDMITNVYQFWGSVFEVKERISIHAVFDIVICDVVTGRGVALVRYRMQLHFSPQVHLFKFVN